MTDHQLDLFPTRSAIGLAAGASELGALARSVPRSVRLGTSSWSFPGWTGLVWDRPATPGRLARRGLAAYALHPLLRTVGLDRTYYAPLDAAAFAALAAQTPADFRFLAKAPEACTVPRTRDTVARRCTAAGAAGRLVYAVVNNKAEGSAPRSVTLLAERIAALAQSP